MIILELPKEQKGGSNERRNWRSRQDHTIQYKSTAIIALSDSCFYNIYMEDTLGRGLVWRQGDRSEAIDVVLIENH